MGSSTGQVIDCPVELPGIMMDSRCDGCSARALFEVQLRSGKSIFLCGHHTKRHMDALAAQGAVVVEMENQ